MFSNYLGDKIKQFFVENKILNGGWALELDTDAITAEIKTAAIQRMQNGVKKADVATGAIAIAAGNTITAQAIGTTYYVITLIAAGTLKLYKGLDGIDQYPVELNDALEDGELPLCVFKAVATAAWTPLSDLWSDADITITAAYVNGVIPGDVPSDLTYATGLVG